jgi:hypothetical protein
VKPNPVKFPEVGKEFLTAGWEFWTAADSPGGKGEG